MVRLNHRLIISSTRRICLWFHEKKSQKFCRFLLLIIIALNKPDEIFQIKNILKIVASYERRFWKVSSIKALFSIKMMDQWRTVMDIDSYFPKLWSRKFSKIVARSWTWTRRETDVHLTLAWGQKWTVQKEERGRLLNEPYDH